EIGDTWFRPTDRVTIVTDPSASSGGRLFGGEDAVVSLSVRTANGQVTTFDTSSDGLDIDPDPSKRGDDFFFISETPGTGRGGAYDGLDIEKVVVADLALRAGEDFTFANGSGYRQDGVSGGGSGGDATGGISGVRRIGDDDDNALTGGPRRDFLDGRSGDDRLDGGGGADRLFGGEGNDSIFGRKGADEIFAGAGNDRVKAGGGHDLVKGGEGNDRLIGGAGRDRLIGGDGNDELRGSGGRDLLHGGEGNDVFVFSKGDRIKDFGRDDGDVIAFAAFRRADFDDLSISRSGGDTLVRFEGETVRLENFRRQLDEEDFNFGFHGDFGFL
ncbi:MAG: calcium-binding protein, partial [Paracoccaceae bacterium]